MDDLEGTGVLLTVRDGANPANVVSAADHHLDLGFSGQAQDPAMRMKIYTNTDMTRKELCTRMSR